MISFTRSSIDLSDMLSECLCVGVENGYRLRREHGNNEKNPKGKKAVLGKILGVLLFRLFWSLRGFGLRLYRGIFDDFA